MKRIISVYMSMLLPALLIAPSASAEALIWGVQVEQLEHRFNEDSQSDVVAWDGDALIGTDEL